MFNSKYTHMVDKNTNVTLDDETRAFVQKVKGQYPGASLSKIIAILAKKGKEVYSSDALHEIAEALLQ